MKVIVSCAVVITMVLLAGCAGVKFSDEQINKDLPEDFKRRNIYPNTDILKYKLDSVVGRILICRPDQVQGRVYDCDLKITRIVKNGTSPDTQNPDQIVYSSKIDRRASAKGSYLVLAAGFDAEQVAEILITDSALVFINDSDVPIEELKAYVETHSPAEQERRFWIQGALLATIIQRDLVKIEANAKGVIGNTSGIEGSVYNHRGQESVDYRISLLMPDIDRDLDKDPMAFAQQDTKNHGLIIRSMSGFENLSPTGGD